MPSPPTNPPNPETGWQNCPPPPLLRSLEAGTLGPQEHQALEQHVAGCSRCEQALQEMAEESDLLIRALARLPATNEDEPEFRRLYHSLRCQSPDPAITEEQWQSALDIDAHECGIDRPPVELPFPLRFRREPIHLTIAQPTSSPFGIRQLVAKLHHIANVDIGCRVFRPFP